MMNEITKICTKCNNEKPISHYFMDRGRRRTRCKQCIYASQDKKKKCATQKLYYQKNREERQEYNKSYYKKNRGKLIQYQKDYKKEHEDDLREYFRLNHHKRKSDPEYRVRRACRARISVALKNNAKKAAKTADLIGCSISELRTHLENQFKDGMNWNNYGEWHVDHIIPCAAFDLTKPDEQRKCFHYNNLQPLWGKENCSKGAKITR